MSVLVGRPADIADMSVCSVEKKETSEVGVEVFPVFAIWGFSGVPGFLWASAGFLSLGCFFPLWFVSEVCTSKLRLPLLLSAFEDF